MLVFSLAHLAKLEMLLRNGREGAMRRRIWQTHQSRQSDVSWEENTTADTTTRLSLNNLSLSRWSGLKKKKKNTHASRALFFSFWGLNMFTTKCVVMESNSASINNDVFTGERKKIRKNPASRRREESLTFCEFVFGGGGVNGSST